MGLYKYTCSSAFDQTVHHYKMSTPLAISNKHSYVSRLFNFLVITATDVFPIFGGLQQPSAEQNLLNHNYVNNKVDLTRLNSIENL